MIYTIENEYFRVSARHIGAELCSFIRKDGNYQYLRQQDAVWNGQSPLLFPIVGRLREDRYQVCGKEYTLKKHGFALKLPFAVEKHSKDEMTFLLTDSEATKESYPFPFELRVHYYFTTNGFVMEHRVKNTGKETMYFSIGAHPGFFCDMGDKIVMDEPETADAFQLDKNALRAEKTLPVFHNSREITVTPTVFENDALIFDGLKSRGASLIRQNGNSVHVDFGGAPCLGIWAKPGASYVCIEPWYGIDDRYNAGHDFTKKERICALSAGCEFVFPVTITTI